MTQNKLGSKNPDERNTMYHNNFLGEQSSNHSKNNNNRLTLSCQTSYNTVKTFMHPYHGIYQSMKMVVAANGIASYGMQNMVLPPLLYVMMHSYAQHLHYPFCSQTTKIAQSFLFFSRSNFDNSTSQRQTNSKHQLHLHFLARSITS